MEERLSVPESWAARGAVFVAVLTAWVATPTISADIDRVIIDPAVAISLNGERSFPRDRLITMHDNGYGPARKCLEVPTPARLMWIAARWKAPTAGPLMSARPTPLPGPLAGSACAASPGLKPLAALTVGAYPDDISEAQFPGTGTPRDPETAATFLIDAMTTAAGAGDPPYRFVEVRNESDLVENWGWHRKPDGWRRIGTFHAVMAKRLHERFPGLCVGGPTFSWPYFERSDYRNVRGGIRDFLRIAGPELDFLSLHAYEGSKRIELAAPALPQGTLERWPATIATLRSCARQETGRIFPMVITEYGRQLPRQASPSAQYASCERPRRCSSPSPRCPDVIGLAVPFILPIAPWDGEFPYLACTWQKQVPTRSPLALFYDLVGDIRGEQIAADATAAGTDLHLLAYRDEDRLRLLVANGSARTRTIVPRAPDGAAWPVAEIRRFRFDADGPVVEQSRSEPGAGIPLDPGEINVLTLEGPLPATDRVRTVVREPVAFCPGETAGRASFAVTVPHSAGRRVHSARLRIAYFHPAAITAAPRVFVGGLPVAARLPVLGGAGPFVGSVVVDLRTATLPANGTVEVVVDAEAPGRVTGATIEAEFD